MGFQSECCPEKTHKFDPFRNHGLGQKQSAKFLDVTEMNPPIKDVIQDTKEVRKFFEKFPYIPYSGADRLTSHNLVCRLEEMGTISGTKGAINTSINRYAFGAKIMLMKGIESNDFYIGNEQQELTSEEARQEVEFLETLNLYGKTHRELTEELSTLYLNTGEFFLELIMDEVKGVRFFGMSSIMPSKVCEKYTEDTGRIIGVSERWDYVYCKKNKPTDYALYPEVTEHKDGSLRTVIHVKNGCKRRGRPSDISSFTDQYNEYKLKEYLSKAIAGNFMGQVFLEIEADKTNNPFGDKQAKMMGHKSTLEMIEDTLTNRGNKPTSILAMTRPKGASKMEVEQIAPNTNEKFYCKIQDQLRKSIIESNGWSEALISMSQASGFNSEMYKDIFNIISATTILSHQETIATPINTAHQIAKQWLGREELIGNRIKYRSPIQSLLEQVAEGAEQEIEND